VESITVLLFVISDNVEEITFVCKITWKMDTDCDWICRTRPNWACNESVMQNVTLPWKMVTRTVEGQIFDPKLYHGHYLADLPKLSLW